MTWNELTRKKGVTSLAWIACCLVQIQTAHADFIYGDPVKVPGINSASGDGSAQISRDGLELYFATNRDHGSNNCYLDIWVARRSSFQDAWSTPVKLDFPGNSDGPDAMPCLSADGLELYFTDFWPGMYGGSCSPSPNGYGGGDLWVSTRAVKTDTWGEVENLGPIVNSSNPDDQPSLSADGLSLYFVSSRPGGRGVSDIYVTTRPTKTDPWGPPTNLGPAVNTSGWEYTPFISPDNLSLYFSRGTAFADIWVSHRASPEEPWQAAVTFKPLYPKGGTKFNVSYAQGDFMLYFVNGYSTMNLDLYDIWQMEVTPVMDLNMDGALDTLDLNELQAHWGSSDSLYDIAPFPLGDGIADDKDLLALREYLGVEFAAVPYPFSNASDMPRDLILNWESGELAQTHDVYFGADYDVVKDATTADSSYMGQQEETRYNPGRLDFGKTYYWRVDEVNGAPDFSVFTGDVWSFTVEPYSIQIDVNNVTASSAAPISTPDMTINVSGLEGKEHSVNSQDMWLSASPDLSPWLLYEFNQTQKLDKMLLWNSNTISEGFMGWGIKDVNIEYSVNGTDWTDLGEVGQISRAPGLPKYNEPQVIDFGLVQAKYVRINILSNWGGLVQQYSVAEVQFYGLPVYAREPIPASGSVDVLPNSVVAWYAGREADQHIVYFSTDPNAVVDGLAPTVTTNTNSLDLTLLDLQLNETYYWRVDEVNEVEIPSVWPGLVCSFTTSSALTGGDF